MNVIDFDKVEPDVIQKHVFSSKRAKDVNVIDFNRIEHDVVEKPVPTFWHHSLDHDAFSSNRAHDMNVIAFNKIEHDVTQKPVPTFWHHALALAVLNGRFSDGDLVIRSRRRVLR